MLPDDYGAAIRTQLSDEDVRTLWGCLVVPYADLEFDKRGMSHNSFMHPAVDRETEHVQQRGLRGKRR